MITLSGLLLGRERRTGVNTNTATGEVTPYDYVAVSILDGMDARRCRMDEPCTDPLPEDMTKVAAVVRVSAYRRGGDASISFRILGIKPVDDAGAARRAG